MVKGSMTLVRAVHTYGYALVNFIVGFCELTLELTATRIIAPYIGLTIYAWTSVIGVILGALAIGYLIGGRLADKRHAQLDIAYLLLGAAVVIVLVNFIKDPYLRYISATHVSIQVQALWASGVLFAPPTIILGCISPYLVRLHLTAMANSGARVSDVTAAGTIGSLCGTFGTGFYLFSIIGSRNLLSLLAAILLVSSCFIAYSYYRPLRVLLIIIVLLGLLMPSKIALAGVTADIDTAYNRYQVIDNGPYRALQNNQYSWQSATDSSDPNDVVLPYTQSFLNVAAASGKQHKYLLIGGGAYVLPAILNREEPRSTVDVVEIDGQLTSISRRYFGFAPTTNTHIINEDGRQFLNHNQQKYSVLYVDAFSNLTPPFQLLTTQSVARQADSLSANGVVAVNIYAAPAGPGTNFVASIAKTYTTHFSSVKLFRLEPAVADTKRQSILLIATNDKLSPTFASLDNNFRNRLQYNAERGKVFSDDFAPVEQLVAQQN